MSRRKDVCICGYETRSDYMRKHVQSCTARDTILKLKDENTTLRARIDFYNEMRHTSDEVRYLRDQLESKNKIIQQKDEEIKRLSSNQNITNHYNVTNVLNIFPFGQEPIPVIERQVANSLLAKPSESVPLYIKMKHFKDGLSNVRIKNNDIEVVEENENGELTWVMKNKDETIFAITDTNLEEFHDEYGSTDFMWKRWFITSGYNQDGYANTRQFQDLMKKVESVFIDA